ncbi:MAG TPA: ATP-binding protein [Solirubrobacteraceae bacterium]|jgi:serine/threonine-protein kinase RsbW
MAGNPNVRLRLANRPENVLLVRQALNGLAETLRLDALELNDVTTAVTEACNNVVLHAYGGAEGPLEVELSAPAGSLDVLVRDRGIGIRPDATREEHSSGGIGLPVIHALAQQVELRNLDGGGTEVEMHFTTSSGRSLDVPGNDRRPSGAEPSDASPRVAALTVAPAPVAGSVLPRLLSALAARAYFPSDRIDDAQTLAETLLTRIDDSASADEHLTITIDVAPHNLELKLGPLESGRASTLLSSAGDAEDDAGLSPLLERLGVGHEVALAGAGAGAGETLAVRLADGGRRG